MDQMLQVQRLHQNAAASDSPDATSSSRQRPFQRRSPPSSPAPSLHLPLAGRPPLRSRTRTATTQSRKKWAQTLHSGSTFHNRRGLAAPRPSYGVDSARATRTWPQVSNSRGSNLYVFQTAPRIRRHHQARASDQHRPRSGAASHL